MFDNGQQASTFAPITISRPVPKQGEHYIRVNNFQILETKATAEARRAQASAQAEAK